MLIRWTACLKSLVSWERITFSTNFRGYFSFGFTRVTFLTCKVMLCLSNHKRNISDWSLSLVNVYGIVCLFMCFFNPPFSSDQGWSWQVWQKLPQHPPQQVSAQASYSPGPCPPSSILSTQLWNSDCNSLMCERREPRLTFIDSIALHRYWVEIWENSRPPK